MDGLELLGKRDIFGIVLPGTIVVFTGAYVLFGAARLLVLPVSDVLKQQFLVSFLIFVFACLVGNLLRLFAADDVDEESSECLVKAWRKKNQTEFKKAEYEECKKKLAKGDDVPDVPDGFDKWLWRVDEFPYPTWQNRKWQAHGLSRVLDFFRDNYGTSMWSSSAASPKTFFNYCKLVVIKSGGEPADEVNWAEGLTRFFAGTAIALRASLWLLGVSFIVQILFSAAVELVGISGVKWDDSMRPFQYFYFALTVVFMLALWWMRRQIVKRFRRVRLKEAETVYHAFYLASGHNSGKAGTRNHGVSGNRENR